MTDVQEVKDVEVGEKRKLEVSSEDPLGLLDVQENCHTITTHLWYDGDASEAVELYQKVFLAKIQGEVVKSSEGRVLHAFLTIGNTNIMMADAFPGYESAPKDHVSASYFLYTKDCDHLHEKCVEGGMESKEKPKDMFWGDRTAKVKDPFGHVWVLATPKKRPTKDEMTEGQKEWEKNFKKSKVSEDN
mmetsp:Transcript_31454/g.49230  ORF Transcript_31454/g.49230 Transcript_31454/m.49230 type:complete len:188 (+) Transcript_31454:119-682(+)|eukprot:CAMPEP_0184327644 /NCGR_PEP_ID=MMETSP1049-20130417/143201_1 /TAXON_ID=77928 /ORGANISM="Proteomonas sulcata, Strain CCMP704" /LENGTH=187 /DNA_ID=CAMNT_0026649907 /DNA_START=121 /DNA_END=684 /DNA_ORIENTATION=+